ncbi:hypothetical protein [Nonomuraea sp. NPDC001023]|uniref:hypothetical protein n=1 Tax=unclassified Nonomuraea TaxID=2593643 RepID=UPI00331E2545
MFLNVLFGILYIAAILIAAGGCLGIYNLFLTDSRFNVGILGHIGVWLVSLGTLAGLITIAASNQWGPFDPDGCSRSHPCVRIIQGQQ